MNPRLLMQIQVGHQTDSGTVLPRNGSDPMSHPTDDETFLGRTSQTGTLSLYLCWPRYITPDLWAAPPRLLPRHRRHLQAIWPSEQKLMGAAARTAS